MNAAHGECHTLVLSQVLGDFHVEGIIENEAGGESAFGDEGQYFGGAGMDMGGVETAGSEEETCEGGTETS